MIPGFSVLCSNKLKVLLVLWISTPFAIEVLLFSIIILFNFIVMQRIFTHNDFSSLFQKLILIPLRELVLNALLSIIPKMHLTNVCFPQMLKCLWQKHKGRKKKRGKKKNQISEFSSSRLKSPLMNCFHSRISGVNLNVPSNVTWKKSSRFLWISEQHTCCESCNYVGSVNLFWRRTHFQSNHNFVIVIKMSQNFQMTTLRRCALMTSQAKFALALQSNFYFLLQKKTKKISSFKKLLQIT